MAVNPIETQKYLGGLDYPASKDDIVTKAQAEGATGDILDALKGLPEKEYDGPTAISQAIS